MSERVWLGSVGRRYGLAVLVSAAALVASKLLGSMIGGAGHFLLLYLAVTISAVYGGFGAGLTATVLCVLAAALTLPPVGSLVIASSRDQVAVGLFVWISVVVCLLGEKLLQARRQAEAAAQSARAHEALKGAMLDTSLEAIVAMDRDGRVREWNATAERLFGRSRGEAIGRDLAELIIPPSLRQRHREGLARHLTTGETAILGHPVELTAIRADGREFPVELVVNRIAENGASLFVGFIRDTTERVAAEAAVRESQALFHNFMDHSPALAFIRDAEGRLKYVNAAYERFFGVTLDQLAGKALPEVVPQETAARLRALYDRVLVENRSLEVQETIPDPAGRLHDCMFYLFPIHEAEGAQYLGGMALDITDQQVLEEQLRQSQKMDAVGRLAGGVAHDFNNMLAVIGGYSDILLTRLPPDDAARGPLEEIQQAATRAADLTRQLLAFSRQQVLAPKRLDLNEVALGMSKMLIRLIGEDVELVALPSPTPAPVVVDPGQLEQVLMNLAVNARDAMPQGGKVTVEVRNVELDDGYVREHFDVKPGPYVRLTVSDTGCGMDRATLARIFEPFFTTKGAGQGTGLGLATVYGIVKQTGGDISVYSEPGCGTAFKIYLPREVGADTRVEPAAPRPEPLTGTETVLLVEDEQMVRQLIRTALQGYGYTVLEAPSGTEALRLCETHEQPIHLVITDVVMPGMSGRELAEQAAALRPEAKILFMSGYTDDAVVRHGVLHAEAEFIQKPFTPTVLGRKVRDVLHA